MSSTFWWNISAPKIIHNLKRTQNLKRKQHFLKNLSSMIRFKDWNSYHHTMFCTFKDSAKRLRFLLTYLLHSALELVSPWPPLDPVSHQPPSFVCHPKLRTSELTLSSRDSPSRTIILMNWILGCHHQYQGILT